MPISTRFHCQVTLNSTHIFMSDVASTGNTYLLDWDKQEWTQLDATTDDVYNYGPCGLVTTEDRGQEVVVTAGGKTGIFSVEALQWRTGHFFTFLITITRLPKSDFTCTMYVSMRKIPP